MQPELGGPRIGASELRPRIRHRERWERTTGTQTLIESAGPRHGALGEESRVPTRTPTESAGERQAPTERAPGPTQTALGPDQGPDIRRGPTQGAPCTETAGARHRERQERTAGPTQRPRYRAPGSIAGPRHRERRAATQRALGPDRESAGARPDPESARFAFHSVRFSKHACNIEVLLIKCW